MTKWIRHGKSPKQRFFESYVIDGSSLCWEWIGAKSRGGYGRLKIENRPVQAHRFSWMIHFGDIPKGMYVCHKCDNPSCVNPNHLFLGDQSDNMRDMSEKGRSSDNRGEQNPNSKLTNDLVSDIRHLWDNGMTPKRLSIKFGVPLGTINNIVFGYTWQHIPKCTKRVSNRGSRLTESDVNEIRRLGSLKVISQSFIGKMFRISQSQVSKIIFGVSWK